MSLKLCFIGLGVMGYPMAGYLKSKGGFDVTVFNRTTTTAAKWVAEHGGRHGFTPAEAAVDADVVFACVGNDDDLRSITNGPSGAFQTMKEGAIFVDHTTTSADVARELYEVAASKKIAFIDAPVSGGQAGAENGALTVMCGGDEQAYKTVEPIIANFAKMCRLMGPSGAGQTTKMVNQICIAGLVQGLAEGINFGKKAGLDIEAVIEVISKGAAQSWQMENRYKTMNKSQFEFGFAVDWMRKDLASCFKEAERVGADLPVAKIVDEFYRQVQDMGGNRWDTSSLLARLEK